MGCSASSPLDANLHAAIISDRPSALRAALTLVHDDSKTAGKLRKGVTKKTVAQARDALAKAEKRQRAARRALQVAEHALQSELNLTDYLTPPSANRMPMREAPTAKRPEEGGSVLRTLRFA